MWLCIWVGPPLVGLYLVMHLGVSTCGVVICLGVYILTRLKSDVHYFLWSESVLRERNGQLVDEACLVYELVHQVLM